MAQSAIDHLSLDRITARGGPEADFLAAGTSYRAISADRLAAAQAELMGLKFSLMGQPLPAAVVFSSVMFMPAVVDEFEDLLLDCLGTSEPLGVVRRVSDCGLLQEEADIAEIDGSPAGLIRGALLEAAWRRALCVHDEQNKSVDLMAAVERYAQRRLASEPFPRSAAAGERAASS